MRQAKQAALTAGLSLSNERITLVTVEQRLEDPAADILLVCSSGGHLQQMLALQSGLGPYSHVWVTFDKSDSRSLLRDEPVVFAHSPTNRSLKNLAPQSDGRVAHAASRASARPAHDRCRSGGPVRLGRSVLEA